MLGKCKDLNSDAFLCLSQSRQDKQGLGLTCARGLALLRQPREVLFLLSLLVGVATRALAW